MRRALLSALALSLATSGAGAAEYPDSLPPEDTVVQALTSSPQITIALEKLRLAGAQRQRLRAGDHEWALGATGQQRKDAAGATFSEQQYEISRGVRWPGKGKLDRALGDQALLVGQHALADAWHEAGRSVLSGWFTWLRAKETERHVEASVNLFEEQLRIVSARVRAADTPRIEQALAQAELDRAAAAQTAASLQASRIALELRRSFPTLELVAPSSIATPQLTEGTDESWTQRILEHNHELELADETHEQSRLSAERGRRDLLPDPTIALQFSNNLDGNDRVVGVAVTLPLAGARRSAQRAIALSEANIAEHRAREAHLRVQSEAHEAVLAARATYSQWQRLAQVATQSANNAQTVARGYALGEFSITELLASRRHSQDAMLEAALARLDALEAGARLRLDAHELWPLPEHALAPGAHDW
jgi:outer membrane protein, heavy metal efflux system